MPSPTFDAVAAVQTLQKRVPSGFAIGSPPTAPANKSRHAGKYPFTLVGLLADSRPVDDVGFPPATPGRGRRLGDVDFETMYLAMDSRDSRFDGRFFVAVKTTGVYCRPICPAPTPKRRNTAFYRYAAVAELAGFRPCRRCRPEVSPDTPEWDTRADLVGRGLRLIAEGVVDDVGVSGLASRLGVSERHLQRTFMEAVGTTPGVMARSRRARLARQLLTETNMPITLVAFAAGFASVRAFNETIQQIYRLTPTSLRRGGRSTEESIDLQLGFRAPFASDPLMRFLARSSIPGVEEVVDGSYRRTIRFGAVARVIELTPGARAVMLRLEAAQADHLAPVIQGARRLMDLDADPEVIDDQLSRSPMLRRLIRDTPGMRLPGAFDPFETAVLSVLQQGSSLTTAASQAGRVAHTFGEPLPSPDGPLTHVFPAADVVAAADLTEAGLAPGRARVVSELADEVSSGSLGIDGSMEPGEARRRLARITGIGPTTVARIAARVLRDPDAFAGAAPGDVGAPSGVADPPGIAAAARDWRPWRGYAAMHLWASSYVVSSA